MPQAEPGEPPAYAPSFSAEGQQDDHCRITFMGENWWIAAKRGHSLGLVNENGRTVLDISGVDWPRYLEAALAMMAERS